MSYMINTDSFLFSLHLLSFIQKRNWAESLKFISGRVIILGILKAKIYNLNYNSKNDHTKQR